ncbi:MAG: hypothetical protein KAV87_14260, partial [Desulfobacteraceae bacterium]|nr:hypothetical protein [Desulfobacteraceae bacterium]
MYDESRIARDDRASILCATFLLKKLSQAKKEKDKPMNVFVTGGTGYLGSALISRLIKKKEALKVI